MSNNLYRHYSGDLYRLITTALLEHTGEAMAVYRSQDGNRTYVRPWSEFVKKFTKVKQERQDEPTAEI